MAKTSKKSHDGKVAKREEPSARSASSHGQYTAIYREWPTSAVELERKYQRQMTEALQHIEQTTTRNLSPMERWEIQSQQDSPYNAVSRYESSTKHKHKKESRKKDEGEKSWSNTGTNGKGSSKH